MKKVLVATCGLIALVATAASAQVNVRGHFRSDGTYVAPHYRSAPDSSRYNNYSTQGNINPYTGSAGTAQPWRNYNYQPTTPRVPSYPNYYGNGR